MWTFARKRTIWLIEVCLVKRVGESAWENRNKSEWTRLLISYSPWSWISFVRIEFWVVIVWWLKCFEAFNVLDISAPAILLNNIIWCVKIWLPVISWPDIFSCYDFIEVTKASMIEFTLRLWRRYNSQAAFHFFQYSKLSLRFFPKLSFYHFQYLLISILN